MSCYRWLRLLSGARGAEGDAEIRRYKRTVKSLPAKGCSFDNLVISLCLFAARSNSEARADMQYLVNERSGEMMQLIATRALSQQQVK